MINGVPAAAATGRVAMFSLLPLPDTDTERFPGPASPFSVKFPLPHAIFFSPLPCFPAQAPVRALKPSSSSSSLASLPLSSMIGSGCGQHDENGPSIKKTSPRPPDAKIWAMTLRERGSTTTVAPSRSARMCLVAAATRTGRVGWKARDTTGHALGRERAHQSQLKGLRGRRRQLGLC